MTDLDALRKAAEEWLRLRDLDTKALNGGGDGSERHRYAYPFSEAGRHFLTAREQLKPPDIIALVDRLAVAERRVSDLSDFIVSCGLDVPEQRP